MPGPTLNEEQIKKFARALSPGDFLFRQNDMGNTMFVIVSGHMEIVEHRGDAEFVVGVLAAGQLIGEKAFLTDAPYRRTYSARAKSDVNLLEFERKHVKIVESIIPNFALRILQIAASRLDRANKIIDVLRRNTVAEKLVYALLFYKEEGGKHVSEGYELEISLDDIVQLTNLDRDVIKMFLDTLIRKKVLRATAKGFVLADEQVLLQVIPELKEILPEAA
jgi:CRP-like cAMP-binding protein